MVCKSEGHGKFAGVSQMPPLRLPNSLLLEDLNSNGIRIF
jgi:hypothetical protein